MTAPRLALGLALLGALVLGAPGRTARAAAPGTLIITDKRIDTSPESFEKEARAAARPSIGKSGDGWKVYFVAWLKKAPGAEEINVVFYEAGGKSREPINHFPIRTKPSVKILVSEVEIRPEDGFKAGNKYDVRITRIIGGREEVYARTTLQLAE